VPDADRFPGDCRGFGQQTGSAAHWNRRAWGEESAPGSTHTWRWSGRPRAKIGPHDRDGYGGAPDHVERGHLDAGGLADNGTGQARYRSDHLSYSGSFSRARRPVEALLLAARLDLEKGLRSQRPNGPGALPAARPPAPNPRLTPRWGFSERRGTKNPRIKSRTQIPTTMAMSQQPFLFGPGSPGRVPAHTPTRACLATGVAPICRVASMRELGLAVGLP
jgi:hypothetical protein